MNLWIEGALIPSLLSRSRFGEDGMRGKWREERAGRWEEARL
jgi:hypothetical protein